MNEDDEIFSVRRLRSTHTSPESGDSMSDDASRLGLRLVGELSETTSHRTRKKIGRGIVWQAATPMTPYIH